MRTDATTLTSLAMLKVNFDTDQRDYIEYLVPFVKHVLSTKQPDPITDKGVSDDLLEEFGIRIPSRGIQLVLRRLAKRRILVREDGRFRVHGTIPRDDMIDRRRTASQCIEEVTRRLREYVKANFDKDWNSNNAEKALLAFLARFSIDCLRTHVFRTALPVVPAHAPGTLYLVGSFVRNAYADDPDFFDQLIVVVKGQMLANALLCPDLESNQKTFKGVAFYFDTPAVLRALGLQEHAERDAMLELIQLVRQLGGDTYVFEHTVEEVGRVIKYCETHLDQPTGINRIITEMRRQQKTRTDIALIRGRLRSELGRLRLMPMRTPDYEQALQIDESVLESALDEDIGYGNPNALRYDINSIRSIYVLRRGLCPVRLEDAAAVFVTTNAALAQVAFEFGRDHESTREVSSVITGYSLANVAWLKAPLGAPQLPMHEVLSTCYALMQPDEKLWTKYIREIDKLREDGQVSATDHEALRFSLRAQDELMDLTLGEDMEFSKRTVQEILEKVKEDYSAEQREALHEEQAKHARTLAARDRLLSERYRSQSRVYWMSARISKVVSWTVVALLGLVLLGCSLASTYYTEKYVGAPYLLTFLVNTAILAGLCFMMINYYAGVTLRGVGNAIDSRVRPWLFRKIAGCFDIYCDGDVDRPLEELRSNTEEIGFEQADDN